MRYRHLLLVLPMILILSVAGCLGDQEQAVTDTDNSMLTGPDNTETHVSTTPGKKGVPDIERCEPMGCRVTGGGVDRNGDWNGRFDKGSDETDRYQFGGQAGANTALPPQPKGEWTHHQQRGPSGSFVFHAGTASAPEGTEIAYIYCYDPDFCDPARPAPNKQIYFVGRGTFKNMKNVPASIADNVIVGESLHYFRVDIDDAGEGRGNDKKNAAIADCPPEGFDEGDTVDCNCFDFYRIAIHAGATQSSPIMYEVRGYTDGGNLQIHPLTGYDLN